MSELLVRTHEAVNAPLGAPDEIMLAPVTDPMQQNRIMNVDPEGTAVEPEVVGLAPEVDGAEVNVLAYVRSGDDTFAVVRARDAATGETLFGYTSMVKGSDGKLQPEGLHKMLNKQREPVGEWDLSGADGSPAVMVRLSRGGGVAIGNLSATPMSLTARALIHREPGQAYVPRYDPAGISAKVAAKVATADEVMQIEGTDQAINGAGTSDENVIVAEAEEPQAVAPEQAAVEAAEAAKPAAKEVLSSAESIRKALIEGDADVKEIARLWLTRRQAQAADKAWAKFVAPKLEALRTNEAYGEARTTLAETVSQVRLMEDFKTKLDGLTNAFHGGGQSYFAQAVHEAGSAATDVFNSVLPKFREEDIDAKRTALTTVRDALGITDEMADDADVRKAMYAAHDGLGTLVNTQDYMAENANALAEELHADLAKLDTEAGWDTLKATLQEGLKPNYAQMSVLEEMRNLAGRLNEKGLAQYVDPVKTEFALSYTGIPQIVTGIVANGQAFTPDNTRLLWNSINNTGGFSDLVTRVNSVLQSVDRG